MLAFQYEYTPSKCYSYAISDVLANIWNTATWDYGSGWMLVDNDAGHFYIKGGSLGDSYKVHQRSIVDGSLAILSSTVYAGPFYLCQVAANGDIWCYDTHGHFYKLDPSTLAITTYTLKSDWDSDGSGDQQYACMTFDGLYFYVTGYTGERVAKFSVANLDGGDPEWYVDLGAYQAYRIFTDSNNDVYVANFNPDSPYNISIRKLSGIDGSILWGPIDTGSVYGGFLCYHAGHHSIYVPYGTNTVRQIDADTGLEIGTSASTGSTVHCCAVGIDGNTLFVGHKNSGITKFDITNNWSGGESNSGWYTVLAGKRHAFAGDPTGYLNSLCTLPVVATPEANPVSGNYSSALLVELSCSTAGADVYYTIDGSDPDESSTLYSESIEILSDTTIKAKAYKAGYDPSDIATFTYTMTITDFTIKAKAFKSNLNPSDTVEFEYTKASLKDPTYQQVVTTIKDIQLVSFNKDTNIAFLEALPNEGYTTGFYLVIQKVVKRLLTDKGSSSFDSTFGSNLCRILGSSELQDDVILKTNLTIILKELVEAINLEFENLEDDDIEITDEMMLSSITVNSLRFDTNAMKWMITLKIVTLANEVASIQLGVG